MAAAPFTPYSAAVYQLPPPRLASHYIAEITAIDEIAAAIRQPAE